MSDINNLRHEDSAFKRNRYIKEFILTEFKKIETIDKVFYLNITLDDELEVHIKEEIPRGMIEDIIAEIQMFDNYVQDFCELNSKKSTFGDSNYMVDLAWIQIEPNKVVMGYWGKFVNIELRAIFIRNNLVWENEDIYWQ